ncbi:arginine/serine-rich coiled-coil protein 2 isoform X2 [Amia ocellicauda]|uniref:arginine/serine-rich coiled-coil protein 2 isoform X2 n=1 Tax=Amia ocellicauda TaxID=2972642 RepID=UPI003463A662
MDSFLINFKRILNCAHRSALVYCIVPQCIGPQHPGPVRQAAEFLDSVVHGEKTRWSGAGRAINTVFSVSDRAIMAASDTDQEGVSLKKSLSDTDRKREGTDSSKSPRSSKHHHSRSRSRSRDRKRKSSDKKHRRSRSRSKEARRKESDDKSSKSHKSEEQHDREQAEKARERLNSENGEDRHRRKEKKTSRGRSYSRSRSRERRHRSRSRERKKSRSRSRDRRSRSRDRKRRARSRSRSRSKHRHRSRSQSKSRERKKRTEKVRRYSRSRSRSVSPPAFRGRNTAMDAQEALARRLERAKKLQEQKEKEMLEKQKQQEIVAAAATGGSVLNVAALLASGTQVTPQIAMAAQMAALQAKTLAETGIAVPSYYNPAAVNPMKFAEQEKKRKMLWQGKKEGDSKSQTAELWEKLNFGNKDQNVKFRKLMGIKGEDEPGPPTITDDESLKTLKQQEEVFRNLDVQYEMARSQTHTQRGMGLGFSSSMRGMDAV